MKTYLVYKRTGDASGCFHIVLFATTNIETAKAYVEKYNRILNYFKSYYNQFVPENDFWIDENVTVGNYRRWMNLEDESESYFEEVELR